VQALRTMHLLAAIHLQNPKFTLFQLRIRGITKKLVGPRLLGHVRRDWMFDRTFVHQKFDAFIFGTKEFLHKKLFLPFLPLSPEGWFD